MIFSALFAGILAAFTPCVLVLFPSLVWRVSFQEKQPVKFLAFFALGFSVVFIILALLITQLLSSSAKYGFQLGIGLIFVTLGVLALLNRFNPLDFPLVKNPFLYGLVFAIIAAVNPCSTAYLGVVLAKSGSSVLTLLFFGIGLLMPAALFAFFGSSLIAKIQKTGKVMHYITQAMNLLLIGMGVYLIASVTMFSTLDVWLAAIMLGLVFLILLRAMHVFSRWKESWSTWILLLVLLIIILAAITHCDTHIAINTDDTDKDVSVESFLSDNLVVRGATCTENIEECTVCIRCISLFVGAALLGALTILIEWLLYKKKLQKKYKKGVLQS